MQQNYAPTARAVFNDQVYPIVQQVCCHLWRFVWLFSSLFIRNYLQSMISNGALFIPGHKHCSLHSVSRSFSSSCCKSECECDGAQLEWFIIVVRILLNSRLFPSSFPLIDNLRSQLFLKTNDQGRVHGCPPINVFQYFTFVFSYALAQSHYQMNPSWEKHKFGTANCLLVIPIGVVIQIDH